MQSKRGFFKLGAYLAGAVLLTLAVACSSAPTATPTAAPAAPTATPVPHAPTATPIPAPKDAPVPALPPEDQPVYGGTIILTNGGESKTLGPLTSSLTQYFHHWGANIYDRITQYNYKAPLDEVIPDLATSWTISNDLKTYTLKIRQGVKWHDGSTLTAQDVAWGLEMLKEKQQHLKTELGTMVSAEATDGSTVKITLSKPRVSLLKVLSLSYAPIVAKHIYDANDGDLSQGPNVGTGPFFDGPYKPNVSVQFTRNHTYWDPHLPYADIVKVLMIREQGTRVAAFRAGKLHALGPGSTGISPVTVEEMRGSVPDLQAMDWKRGSVLYINMNAKAKPWDDVRVRRAAFLAIDRFQAVQAIDEIGAVAGPAVTPSWALPDEELLALPGYRKGAEKAKDIEAAKKLLTEAGYPDGFDTEAKAIHELTRHQKFQVFYVDQLAKVGIRVKSTVIPLADWFQHFQNKTFQLITLGHGLTYADPDASSSLVKVGLFQNVEDDKLVELFTKQASELDEQKRREIVYDLQRRSIEIANEIPVGWEVGYYTGQPNLRGLVAKFGSWACCDAHRMWLAQ